MHTRACPLANILSSAELALDGLARPSDKLGRLTCFLLGLLWAGVTGVAGPPVLGVDAEPTDLLPPVCTAGDGLAACLDAEAPGDAFALPCTHSLSSQPYALLC